MPIQIKRGLLCIALATGLLVPRVAHATVIQFQALDLADVFPGADLWQYEYRVSERTFEENEGFSTYFDALLYADLQVQAASADWDPIVVAPDPELPSDGFYDVVAMITDASLDDRFLVSFVWLGPQGTTPGAQPFTINRYDAEGGLSILERGATAPFQEQPAPVPEPSTLALTTIGALGVLRTRRAKRTS